MLIIVYGESSLRCGTLGFMCAGIQFDIQQQQMLSNNDAPQKKGLLSFNQYFGNISVATKWLVSVVLAMIQDVLITRTGFILTRAVIRIYIVEYFRRRKPQQVEVSTPAASTSSGKDRPDVVAVSAEETLIEIMQMVYSQLAFDSVASSSSFALFRLDSKWRQLWVLARLALVAYLFVISPLRWGFYADKMDSGLIADYIVDFFFALDLCFRAFRFHTRHTRPGWHGSRLMVNAADILGAVWESNPVGLVMSVVATFPLDVLVIPAGSWRAVFWIRMLKLGHLGLIRESLAFLHRHGRFAPNWKSLEDPILPTVFWLVATLVASAHVFACGLWLLGSSNYAGSDESDAMAWFTSGNRSYSPSDPLGDRYLVSLYFVVYTLITVRASSMLISSL